MFLGSFFLVVIDKKKLSFRVRSVEGEEARIRLLVVTKKNSHNSELKLCALSLHSPLSSAAFNSNNDNLPLSFLRLEGNFTYQKIYRWLATILPSMPENSADNNRNFSFCFKNVCTGTLLICEYKENNVVELKSDSLSTIAILREQLRHQNEWNISQEFINDDCIPHFLRLVQPKLAERNLLDEQYALLPTLRELGGDASLLSHDDLQILRNASNIEQQFQNAPNGKADLTGILTDFFIDRLKFAGLSSYSPTDAVITRLILLLNAQPFDLDATVAFFHPTRHFAASPIVSSSASDQIINKEELSSGSNSHNI
mmetsp:Transcript_318/g.422  ORF Transcript_318/g.422 Transcript_318/m.422 type:complete len:313 (+) Transcript_318:1022-1960(+)